MVGTGELCLSPDTGLTNQSILDDQGRSVPVWVDVLNYANLGIEVIHERNVYNFSLDFASGEAQPTEKWCI